MFDNPYTEPLLINTLLELMLPINADNIDAELICALAVEKFVTYAIPKLPYVA